ncbi:Ig-like domain-containing protein [bacterium]|nr:Ig-like domain-containing protein [bacterium]
MSTRMMVLGAGLLAIILLCGCGGGSGSGGGDVGSLRFSVRFPALPDGVVMPEYLPAKLMSLVIEVIDTNTGLPKCAPIIVNRTSPSEEVVNVTVEAVHIGATTLIIKGYDGLNGTGTVICDATAGVEVLPNVAVSVTMTMATTVIRIEITGASSVLVGGNTQLTATGYDVDGNVVLDADFTWSSLDNTLAQVDQTGLVTGVARGNTGIKVEEAKAIATPAIHNIAVNPNIDRVEITTVGSPYVAPAGTAAGGSTTINIWQYQDIVAKCYSGSTEITDVPITFTSGDNTTVTVAPAATDSPNATIHGIKEGGPVTITASQPYTSAVGTLSVTVTALGDINIIVN